jgi:hypothetical protein
LYVKTPTRFVFIVQTRLRTTATFDDGLIIYTPVVHLEKKTRIRKPTAVVVT